ncbi:MAG: AMP-binding protein [Rhodospirillaceae bacterium]|jgi:long-chain acyl-CoA synthetase|nr:AMP-binding protein [Rhodospirillaceae bacterium]MBT7768611.1 AMP-binding protein [Rhodospirillales bacterium]MBT4701427.1 AMP-binding protein [Rhodospirillaceae bacterium]MBT5033143.1 AMP-binding protein [Rhodospirillaceae bacterium]MBT6219241.1 AMP-binding protein [Rhodospirillaceae bacterium]
MTAETWPNLVTMFFDQAAEKRDAPFLWAKTDGTYHDFSWSQAASIIEALAHGLKAAGVNPGDRVVLISENRPEWLMADMAIMAAGGISVPAYTTNTTADHVHILSDSGAVGVIVSNDRLAKSLIPAAEQVESAKFIVGIDALSDTGTGTLQSHTWASMTDSNDKEGTIKEEAQSLKRTDTACIIYTSGTGGAPKGVLLSHGAILHNCAGSADAIEPLGLDDNVFLSFLPLSHSYEHMAGQFFPVSIGAEIYYAEGVETLSANMLEARPTIMTAVPRLYEMMHGRILAGVQKAGGLKEKMFLGAVALGTQRFTDSASLSVCDRFKDAVLDKLVRNKVRGRFGGRLKALVSGGAPLNPDIGMFFTALGLTILQGYGQTESAPLISVNRPGNVKMETVGPVVKNTEVKIADDGEILARGELLMQGYWGNEEATQETIIDGWLHTGDIGEFDADGHLKITDRKKDIIVNSGGDNLSPQRVEGILCLEPEIGQAMVYGDKRPHLVGLIVPDDGWQKSWARENPDQEDLLKELRTVVNRVNAKLSNIEKVRHIILAGEAFTIDNEQMTPTMKIRRHKIKEIYGAALEGLYV